MPVSLPRCYGILVRKNDKTRPFVERQNDRLRAWVNERVDLGSDEAETRAAVSNEDEHLAAYSVAMNGYDLESDIERLEGEGCVFGVDFVPTDSEEGVLFELPDWLDEELLPTGNPPELEAKMEPEVRRMWEQSRQRVYSLRAVDAPPRGTRLPVDELTQLPSGAAFQNTVKQRMVPVMERREPVAVLFVDVDNLAHQNNEHGPRAVDQALHLMARTLVELTPAGALVGRLGSDDFLVYLPGVRLGEAVDHAERMRHAIEQAFASGSPAATDHGLPALTVSMGVATGPLDDDWKPGVLMELAYARLDTAQHFLQRRGNRVWAGAVPPEHHAQVEAATRHWPRLGDEPFCPT